MFDGKKVALVATGGGSRGIAHMGVMKACEELGIKLNIIIGASAGALIGAYYSQYQSADMVIDHVRPPDLRKYDFEQFGWHKMMTFKNLFSPYITRGIFDLSNAERFLEKSFEINDFNNLKIPLLVAATNLNDHCGMLFGDVDTSHVPISKAVVASCCIPLLFRPVEIGGKLYVDGEIKRPLSVDAAIDRGADIVIVSDTYSPALGNISKMGMFDIASEVVNMVLEDKSMRGVSFSKKQYPDKKIVMVSPRVGHMSAFNSSSYEEFIKEGYDATMNAFKEII